ncbi:MAG: ankyrin repeat domain-containing protein [Planctomycetota bacterium]
MRTLAILAVALSVTGVLTAGEVVDVHDADRPELPAAASRGEWATVGSLLEVGADPTTTLPDGTTALHYAAFAGRDAIVARLIAAGADVSAENRYGVQPLRLACMHGHADAVAALLEGGADPDAASAGGERPLMTAARAGDVATVALLLGRGVDADATEASRQTALMWAASAGHGDVVAALLAAGADADKATRSGMNALHFAARDGRVDVVRTLLDGGVDVGRPTKPGEGFKSGGQSRAPRRGTSALLFAVESGHFELALMLVERGADPNDLRSGFAPLHAISWTRKAGRGDNPGGDPEPRGSGEVGSLEFVRRLVAAGADVNLPVARGKRAKARLNLKGATPALLAARTADRPLLELLVSLGADPHTPNSEGCTPLMAAAGVGVQAVGEEAGTEDEVCDVVSYLVSLGADVNVIDSNRETAMHGAAYRNFPAVVDLLAASGADPDRWDHKNRAGWTPMRIAVGYRPGSFKPSPPTQAALLRAGSRTADAWDD